MSETPDMDSDFDLITQIKRRDPDALLRLYQRHGGHVFSLTLAILGESTDAEEATQDTFVKVWNHPDGYLRDYGRFEAWLMMIARRCALDRLRFEKRRLHPALSLDQSDFPELRDNYHEQEARWRDLSSLLDVLPAEQREVLTLAYYRGMSQSEIAGYLELPVGTVKSRLRLGMERLRANSRREDGV